MLTLELRDLDELLAALANRGYQILGPTIRDKAIVIDQISSVKDLPGGWTDRQEPGSYSLERRDDAAVFGYVVGPLSWKAYLAPPRARVFSLRKNGKGFEREAPPATHPPKPLAFIGVRACDLHAIELTDRVFQEGPFPDTYYKTVRSSLFILAVDCAEPGEMCFCTSFSNGPKAEKGFDIALTELCDPTQHLFVARAGSERGEEVLASLNVKPSSPDQLTSAELQSNDAIDRISRHIDVEKTSTALSDMFDHPAWEEVSKRCLACANCTMVCPTCFCSTVEEITNLTGTSAERWRRWDSCFTMDFTKVAGGNVRPSTKARFRQRVMHKFSYWLDQFGSAGCVGCGRCTTWCPAGIDVTSYLDSLCAGQGNGTR